MTLAFRNIDLDARAPVEEWGFEGLLAAVERGEASHWLRIALAVGNEPWGPVARLLEEEVLPAAADVGVAGALRRMIALQRDRAEQSERDAVSGEFRSLVEDSGLTQGAFALRLGTSRTRLNTYLSGATIPSATVMVRARRLRDVLQDGPHSTIIR